MMRTSDAEKGRHGEYLSEARTGIVLRTTEIGGTFVLSEAYGVFAQDDRLVAH